MVCHSKVYANKELDDSSNSMMQIKLFLLSFLLSLNKLAHFYYLGDSDY